jgi:CheY-like chemotaxis protein
MVHRILLIEDQPDIRGLLRSALSTLRGPDIEIFEAASGQQAVQEFARGPIDLLVLKNRLPDIPGIELLHGLRAIRPNLSVIAITDASDRGKRDEILNAGASAVFEKPVPLGDFLDAVERGLGLSPTIFPLEATPGAEAPQPRIADLLANLRQDMKAQGVFLINERGLVAVRAGGLRDGSMEVSLISGLAAIFSAGIKVARSYGQKALQQYSVFPGDGEDLILMPVDPRYALLLAGRDLASAESREHSLGAMRAVCAELERVLRQAEMTDDSPPRVQPSPSGTDSGSTEMDELLRGRRGRATESKDLDSFWEEASARSTEVPADPDSLSFEEARKLGLTPEDSQP